MSLLLSSFELDGVFILVCSSESDLALSLDAWLGGDAISCHNLFQLLLDDMTIYRFKSLDGGEPWQFQEHQ